MSKSSALTRPNPAVAGLKVYAYNGHILCDALTCLQSVSISSCINPNLGSDKCIYTVASEYHMKT
jgi:hypothetical protein